MIDRLPEKWCIDVSDFNKVGRIVANYIGRNEWYLNSPKNVAYLNFTETNFDFWSHIARSNNLEYTEITFEEFKHFIINKQPPKPSKPEDLSYLIDFLKQQQIT